MPEVLRFGIHSLDELLGVPSEKCGGETPFGIYLPRKEEAGQEKESDEKKAFTTSICIVGPNGTGKSIFGLHMSSRYLADCIADNLGDVKKLPAVLYISTDFTFNMANRVWNKFALNYPFSRKDPFSPPVGDAVPYRERKIDLVQCNPTILAENFDLIEEERGGIIFVDIASYTAGDDWGFLHKLISLLPKPEGDAPRHLVVIDAIEGFEALAGELNAFGEKSSRRSRVAQAMRLISGKCHVLLVVEERKNYERLAEEFVADTVIRLENIVTRNYERRVLKIEKVRGQSHIRGQHHYSIRSGDGSTTGSQGNPDDPKVAHPAASESGIKNQSYMQVFHSVHRLNRRIMELEREARKPLARNTYYAAFGINYLDNMLGGTDEIAERQEGKGEYERYYFDTRGLPCRSTTALIGDSLTQKSILGKAFLGRCFYSFHKRLEQLRRKIKKSNTNNEAEDIWALVRERIELLSNPFGPIDTEGEVKGRALVKEEKWLELLEYIHGRVDPIQMPFPLPDHPQDWPKLLLGDKQSYNEHPDDLLKRAALTHLAAWLLDYKAGVAVMLSTHNTHNERLTADFIPWLHSETDLENRNKEMPGYEKALENYIRLGTICRRLEIHNLSSEILIHIVHQAIKSAQGKFLTSKEISSDQERYRKSWPIRVVIDDFSAFRDIFPELREDPLLLPSILFHFEREGVTTLIVDTQSGKPDTPIAERFESELRKLVQHNLYTWRVPFYGESRVAITAIPPFSYVYAGIVRELRWETDPLNDQKSSTSNEPAKVDPHFELYTGLEEGKPQSVPLRVHFYAETPGFEAYIEKENRFLSELFVPCTRASQVAAPSVIVGVPAANYNELRDFAYLQRDTRLDHTLVFQVDEFWAMRPPKSRKRAGAFRPQWSYLNAVTAHRYKPDPDADPYELFQLRKGDLDEKGKENEQKPPRQIRRRYFYSKYYEDFSDYEQIEKKSKGKKKGEGEPLIDRVPFIWDFGFLLCQERAWATGRAFRVREKVGEDESGEPIIEESPRTVQGVWNALKKAAEDNKEETEYISWRVFIEACKKAAEGLSDRLSKPVTAFDFAQISPESFSCLMLEVWFSEIYDTLDRAKKEAKSKNLGEEVEKYEAKIQSFLDTVSKRRLHVPAPGSKSGTHPYNRLSALLEVYWLELYKSWLLLIEVLNFSNIVGEATALNFDFQSKNTDFSAIASRHWYKSASQCPDEVASKESLVAVRLPGHFSARGDWFLAVSGSSRSIRQAERIMDLLNSRRANVTRLQLGIGLPTRFPVEEYTERLRTKLISHEQGQDNVEYGKLLKIGAGNAEKDEFHWLWRSSLSDYVHCNRIWHKWLNRMLLSWYRNLLRYKSVWRNSFMVYDELTNYPPSKNPEDFAPTDVQLKEFEARTKGLLGEDYEKELQDFLGRYKGRFSKGGAKSLAQLKVRGDFMKLWDVLKMELEQASQADHNL